MGSPVVNLPANQLATLVDSLVHNLAINLQRGLQYYLVVNLHRDRPVSLRVRQRFHLVAIQLAYRPENLVAYLLADLLGNRVEDHHRNQVMPLAGSHLIRQVVYRL